MPCKSLTPDSLNVFVDITAKMCLPFEQARVQKGWDGVSSHTGSWRLCSGDCAQISWCSRTLQGAAPGNSDLLTRIEGLCQCAQGRSGSVSLSNPAVSRQVDAIPTSTAPLNGIREFFTGTSLLSFRALRVVRETHSSAHPYVPTYYDHQPGPQ